MKASWTLRVNVSILTRGCQRLQYRTGCTDASRVITPFLHEIVELTLIWQKLLWEKPIIAKHIETQTARHRLSSTRGGQELTYVSATEKYSTHVLQTELSHYARLTAINSKRNVNKPCITS